MSELGHGTGLRPFPKDAGYTQAVRYIAGHWTRRDDPLIRRGLRRAIAQARRCS